MAKLHSPEQVARIKGAVRAGLGYDLVAELSGVPWETVKKYALGIRRRNVKPNPAIVAVIRKWLRAR